MDKIFVDRCRFGDTKFYFMIIEKNINFMQKTTRILQDEFIKINTNLKKQMKAYTQGQNQGQQYSER